MELEWNPRIPFSRHKEFTKYSLPGAAKEVNKMHMTQTSVTMYWLFMERLILDYIVGSGYKHRRMKHASCPLEPGLTGPTEHSK